VRWLFYLLLWVTTASLLPAAAQNTVVQEFSGSGSTTTARFKVEDRWEVRWNARQVVSVAVMSANGTIVAGVAGVLRGSLFVPLGGQYYFKITDGTVAPPADTNSAPVDDTNTPTAIPPAATDSSSPPPSEPAVSWHLQVVELGKSAASNQALTVYTPFFIVPASAITPVATPIVVPPPALTNEQIQAMVTVKGDNAQGAGFLMRSAEGTFVVTNLHLLAANPNLKIFTNSGAPVTTRSLKGATDRDLAFFTIQDDHFSYLPLPADAANSIEVGEQVIIPNIGQQTDVLLGKLGKVIGMGPERIDFDNAMGPGSSGAPVIHVKSGNVLALVTAVEQVDLSDDLAQAWPANPPPGSAGIIPYFGLRLNSVQGWETYDWPRFLAETTFLKQFHHDTRCLDSYLNGKHRRARSGSEEIGPPDTHYFLNNTKISKANDAYKQLCSGGADRNQRLEAARELLSDLGSIADTDISTLQGMTSLYSFNQVWAREEMAYRKALKKELDDLGGNIVRMDNLARSR
jgi:S1-C subfamily serine protease